MGYDDNIEEEQRSAAFGVKWEEQNTEFRRQNEVGVELINKIQVRKERPLLVGVGGNAALKVEKMGRILILSIASQATTPW